MNFINVSNAVIEQIQFRGTTAFVTITYEERQGRFNRQQTVVLVVTPNTVIRDSRNRLIRARDLEVGMIINALFSSAMTRSIPPQAQAYQITIGNQPPRTSTSEGRILRINVPEQFIVTINNNNLSSAVRFNITNQTVILDPFGRRISLRNLIPGLRVRVEHANFMTASIPPQTPAFRIQVIR